jgi:hypothetical protein
VSRARKAQVLTLVDGEGPQWARFAGKSPDFAASALLGGFGVAVKIPPQRGRH